MRLAFWQRLLVLTVLGWGISNFGASARAVQFDQQEVDQNRFIVLAAPGGQIGYKLLIVEQLNDKRPCWSETGSNPSSVEPLLLNFDFTGICNRVVDSNGFSMRAAGIDQALQYSLRILKDGDDLVLVAASNSDRNTLIEIGRTHGMPTGFSRIVLDPGWRLTRRVFNGRAVGHIYLTYDQPIDVLVASAHSNPIGRHSLTSPITQPPAEVSPNGLSPEGTPDSPTPGGLVPVPTLPPAAPVLPPNVLPNSQPNIPTDNPNFQANSQAVVPQTETPPNLSTILPPPPPISSPPASALPPVPSESSSPGSPLPSTGSAPGSEAANSPTSGTSSAANSPASGTSSAASSPTANSPADRTSPTANSPTTNSPVTSSAPSANRPPLTLSSLGVRSSDRPSNSPAANRPPLNAPPLDRSPAAPDSSAASPSNSQLAQAETYQVIVIADSAETQDKVRNVAPSAFLTTINGQVVMQVGVFRDRQEADRLQQRLSLEGLPTAVIPVR